MAVSITSGPATVIERGTVTTFGGLGLTLELDLVEGCWSIQLVFKDRAETDPAVSTEITDTGMIFECVNFTGVEGKGSAAPVLLDELGVDLIFFHFRVFQHGASDDRTVHYTFYRVHKDAVDWQPSSG